MSPHYGPASRAVRDLALDIPEFGAPLLALGYDPCGKGSAIILSTGEKHVDYEHTVSAPVELAGRLNADGNLDSLEILDEGDGEAGLISSNSGPNRFQFLYDPNLGRHVVIPAQNNYTGLWY